MFKKLRERIYNKKMNKEMKGISFDGVKYCGYDEFPKFVRSGTAKLGLLIYTPKTDETFKYAFTKLKNEFFNSYDEDEIKNRIRVYMSYFKISEQAYAECMDIVKNTNDIVVNA